MTVTDLDLGRYKLGWSDDVEYVFKPEKGLNTAVVDDMSWWKGEPEWMRQLRQKSLRTFERKPMLPWFLASCRWCWRSCGQPMGLGRRRCVHSHAC